MFAYSCSFVRNVVKLLVFLVLPSNVFAQVLPVKDAKLNYRIIGFSFPDIPANANSKLEIAEGYYNNIDSFQKNIITTQKCNKNRVVAKCLHSVNNIPGG